MAGITMKESSPSRLPLTPLLHTYLRAGIPGEAALSQLPGLGERFGAVRAARAGLLADAFVEGTSEMEFATALAGFYNACVQPALHTQTLARRAGIVRHALGHLLRCSDPLPYKVRRCLDAAGPYHVPGLGPAFWSAVLQGLDPTRHPAWTPQVESGLRRLGLAAWQAHDDAGAIYAGLLEAYAQLRAQAPGLSALHLDHFLTLVAAMKGRNLWSGSPVLDLDALVRQERARVPLRRRLKERGQALQRARTQLETGLASQDGAQLGAALAIADPESASRARIDWQAQAEPLTLWIGRLWEADKPTEIVEAFARAHPIPGGGLWLPAAVLHLRDAQRYFPWSETARRGYAALDDSDGRGDSPAERYRLFNEGSAELCSRYRLHPLEAPGLLDALAAAGTHRDAMEVRQAFGGFCVDTFQFLAELGQNNCRTWMETQRERYRFAVREPLVELCRALTERYVEPVLRREYGWDLETVARSGGALSSLCKNDYGRSVPYQTVLWITFYRRDRGGKSADAQFFVRLDAAGLRYGLSLGQSAQEVQRHLRTHVEEHAELLYRKLADNGALGACVFGTEADFAAGSIPANPQDLRAWAGSKGPVAARVVPADAALLTTEELVGDILLTFDRLLPLYACAVEPDPLRFLAQRSEADTVEEPYTAADFYQATFLDEEWLAGARTLLDLKRQLILQGVPGTGKTHVARGLARLLARGREEAIRLVQFHPAYSYEEFVEGIKVRTVEVNGRQDVSYPVEDGLLCTFAAEAARHPAQPHVLLIDEINRGNLPRIFGELLYLLEYREQSIALPYSKRGFALPANLYLIGTMNAADRSVTLIDQALRRRFSFLDMAPDRAVLAAWLQAHPPADAGFADQVVRLFDRLNTLLRADLGLLYQIGHSYLMVPDLDAARLRVVWQHQVRPLLEEYFAGHPARLTAYELDRLLGGSRRSADARKRRKARVPG